MVRIYGINVSFIQYLKLFCRLFISYFAIFLEIPVLPTITAKITFQEFEWNNDLSDELFLVPDDFKVSGAELLFYQYRMSSNRPPGITHHPITINF